MIEHNGFYFSSPRVVPPSEHKDLRGKLPSIPIVQEDGSSCQSQWNHFQECVGLEQMNLFIRQLAALPYHLRGFLTEYALEDYLRGGARLFLAGNAQGGYGLIGDELISVFSLPGARLGPSIVADAVRRGARRADVLDAHKGGAVSDPRSPGKLVALYGAFGFREVERHPWNVEYAPAHWDYALWGSPDHVVLARGTEAI